MKCKHTAAAVLSIAAMLMPSVVAAQKVEYINYGNFNSWVTRHLKESGVIGGKAKTVYAIGPTQTIEGNKAYLGSGGSPWASSNVYAKVAGVVKASNSVFPVDRGGGNKCAKLSSMMEHLKALGIVNMDVMVTGSIYLGKMMEPISSTSNPYGKLDMGIPYTKRPTALIFDYKAEVPTTNTRTKATGFGSTKTIQGRDMGSAFVLLQRRWEDEKGNIHAKRVGTGGEVFTRSTPWVNGHKLPIKYGSAGATGSYKWNKLFGKSNAFYAKNSKGKLVPVIEEGWDDANATPTHAIVFFSSAYYEAFVGTEGLNLYIDNVGFAF